MRKILQILLGFVAWIILFLLHLIVILFTWNWKETEQLNMGKVMTELFGKSLWYNMTGYNED